MMGDKLGDTTGRITGQRVLPNSGAGPKLETSFQASGKLLGVSINEIGTYWAVVRADGTHYGEGQGVIMGKNGESATWVGSGVGTMKKNGAVSYRGAVYYTTSTRRWVRLNRVAAVFEFEVDAQGASRASLWEWK